MKKVGADEVDVQSKDEGKDKNEEENDDAEVKMNGGNREKAEMEGGRGRR